MKGIFVKASADTAAQMMCIRDFPEPYLETLGAAVGGDAELVRPKGLERPYCMVVNESGLLLELPVNLLGSILYDPTYGHPIVGNIVILKTEWNPKAMGEDLAGLSVAEAAELVAELRTMTGGRVQFRKEE